MKTKLTDRQREIYDWILAYAKLNGAGPTVREVAAQFAMSPNGAKQHMNAMCTKGWLYGVFGDVAGTVRYYRPCCGYVVEAVG